MGSAVVLSDADRGIFVPGELKPFTLTYDGHKYEVIDAKGLTRTIGNESLSKELRGISVERFNQLQEVGYVSVRKSGESFALDFYGRLKGGFFLTAIVAYVGTTVAGTAMVVGGALLVPVSAGASAALITAGASTIAAAPLVAAAATAAPTP